jgi:TPR repeat protein
LDQALPGQASTAKPDPARQLAECRKQADLGDADAAFQMGMNYLMGQGVAQDAATAEQYFNKAQMTPARMCIAAETYMETAVPGRVEAATRWAAAAHSGCGDWAQAQWWGSNRLGPDHEKEVAFLKRGLAAQDDDFRNEIAYRLGELLLTGTAVTATPQERVAWIGLAARLRLGMTEMAISGMLGLHPDEAESPEAPLQWVRYAARYGTPNALAALGGAAMTREASDLSYLDGMALYELGARQNLFSSVSLESQKKTLEPALREELANAVAKWQRIAQETGGYYAKGDALRLADPLKIDDLVHAATPENPDAELRLAYVYETRGELAKAEALDREVWQNGPGQLWLQLGLKAGKAGKWAWARELLVHAAEVGSRPACTTLARIDAQGLSGKKDALSAYLWLLRAETRDPKLLAAARTPLSKDQLKTVELSQAEWVVAHKEYWPHDLKTAQAIVDANQQAQQGATRFAFTPQPPVPTTEELLTKADAGDLGAAYLLAVRLLGSTAGIHPDLEIVERYAAKGAITAEQKAHIAYGYSGAQFLDEPTRRKYQEKWWLAVGGSRCYYELGKLYNGKSDGIVQTDDEKTAVAHWQRAVDAGDERWARLARMELGYRVVKGWTSGNRAHDAAWAHELAMEFLGKEFFQVAGDYSYGRELAHDEKTYLMLCERAAIYNIDNAQGQLAKAIIDGNWKPYDDMDAYAWMKLRGVKQDVGDNKQVELAETNPELKRAIASRYKLLLDARASSGAFYPQSDPLLTAHIEDIEPRVLQQDPEAQLRLGSLLEAQATDASFTRAIALCRQIWATAGQEVRLTWGRTLMNGTPTVPRDDVGAQKWLWDAANAGSHEACRLLATIYREGRGVPADPVAAEAWTELADPAAPRSADLTADQARALAKQIADWRSNHPAW